MLYYEFINIDKLFINEKILDKMKGMNECYKKNKIHKGSQKVYFKNGDIVVNKVNSFEEFKNLYNYYINNFLFDYHNENHLLLST